MEQKLLGANSIQIQQTLALLDPDGRAFIWMQ